MAVLHVSLRDCIVVWIIPYVLTEKRIHSEIRTVQIDGMERYSTDIVSVVGEDVPTNWNANGLDTRKTNRGLHCIIDKV